MSSSVLLSLEPIGFIRVLRTTTGRNLVLLRRFFNHGGLRGHGGYSGFAFARRNSRNLDRERAATTEEGW